jgi:hypothetical protein
VASQDAQSLPVVCIGQQDRTVLSWISEASTVPSGLRSNEPKEVAFVDHTVGRFRRRVRRPARACTAFDRPGLSAIADLGMESGAITLGGRPGDRRSQTSTVVGAVN